METAKPTFTVNYPTPGPDIKTEGKKYLPLIILVVLGMMFWAWISNPMVVTVAGAGEVTVPATNALISFTITSNDSSAQNAINNVKDKAAKMREFLVSKGISEEDIAEGQVTAVPASLVAVGQQGFQASISMAANTVHVSDAAFLISDLYTNGVSIASQPVLSVENQAELEEEAFAAALKNAKKEAGIVGTKNWKFIRKIVAVSQAGSSNTSTATTKADTITESKNGFAAQNGVFKIVKAVSVSYKMW